MSHKDDLLHDPQYAHTYLAELQDITISAQICALREDREWSQQELAQRSNIAQSRISLFEGAEYNGYSLATLRKLAKAFDVGLRVRFAPYYACVRELENSNRDRLSVVSREIEATRPTSTQVVMFPTNIQGQSLKTAPRINFETSQSQSDKLERSLAPTEASFQLLLGS